MSYIIAVAGKGGTGKTTIAALLVKLIKERKLGSLLAIDADPNSTLPDVLGVEAKDSIGSILDRVAASPDKIPSGMTKERFIEYEIQSAILEKDGFDLLIMGKPEGPGCYCYVNNVLRNQMNRLIKDYDFIIIDNEAGLEHLSRRTTRKADLLLVIADPSAVSLRAAERINNLAQELKIELGRKALVINRSTQGINNTEAIKKTMLSFIGEIPLDQRIAEISANGASLMNIENDALSVNALRKIGDKIWRLN